MHRRLQRDARTRLLDLWDILPVPSEGLSFLGGEESVICFDEVRCCYLDGSNFAVVLLCLAYVERDTGDATLCGGLCSRVSVHR